jgi:iron(III) transport system ATP-binding protein
MNFLTVTDLGKTYGRTAALAGIDMVVRQGSRTTILGPSGSGKTTLLRLIAGFAAPDTGSITLDGKVLADARSFVPAHLRGIGVVMQDGALFPHLTIAENIGFGLKATPDRQARVQEMLDLVGLDPVMLTRKPDQLSGGQQQRVALARALAMKPRLLLLDEPFSALDTGLRTATRNAVAAALDAAGVTAILVTHDQGEALSFSDQVVLLEQGRLMQVGTPQDLYFRPKTARVAHFLGEAIILPATIANGQARCSLGLITVEADGFAGQADILLRPEQIRLMEADSTDASNAVVEATNFGGAATTITIRLLTSGEGGQTLTLPANGAALKVGARVSVAPSGVAHRLEGFST